MNFRIFFTILFLFTLFNIVFSIDCSANPSQCAACGQTINHNNQDWIITNNTEIAGNHININNFIINQNIIVTVKAYNGTNCGEVSINASNIEINGTITATGKGYGGGGGGGGGGGLHGGNNSGTRGSGGTGYAGGLNGTGGSITRDGGAGGRGGGAYGGNGGSASYTTPYSSQNGLNGGYRASQSNGESSSSLVTENIWMGSGGGGGRGGQGGSTTPDNGYRGGGAGAGGAGNPGGGAIKLIANENFILGENGKIFSRGLSSSTQNGASGGNATTSRGGNGGNGGNAHQTGSSLGGGYGESNPTWNSCYYSGSFWPMWYSPNTPNINTHGYCFRGIPGGDGGTGAGGGILIKSPNTIINGEIDNRGGSGTTNGGTVKIFCQNNLPILSGSIIRTGNEFYYQCEDITPPIISATNSSEEWFDSERRAVINAQDFGGSGIKEIRYEWKNIGQTSELSSNCSSGGSLINNLDELIAPIGEKILYLCARDNSNNHSNWSGHYKTKYLCTGEILNATICIGSDEGLTENTGSTLVSSCKSSTNKCIHVCNDGFMLKNNSCQPPSNSIDFFNAEFIDDSLVVTISCLLDSEELTIQVFLEENLDITIFDENEEKENTKLFCSTQEKNYFIKTENFENNKIYQIISKIEQPCNICSKEIFKPYKSQNNVNINDNNLILVIFILLAIFTILKFEKNN